MRDSANSGSERTGVTGRLRSSEVFSRAHVNRDADSQRDEARPEVPSPESREICIKITLDNRDHNILRIYNRDGDNSNI